MIWRLPGTIPAGTVCETPVAGIDLVPTFFQFAGIDAPWKMHGEDISPLLKNPNADRARPVLLANTNRSYGSATNNIPTGEKLYQGGVPWYVLLRQDKYKYVRSFAANELEELYDLQADPEELTNLAIAPDHKQTLRRFRKETIAELRRTDAGFVDSLPPVRE
jgi:arylsulfatase A-like enzyme